MANNMGRDLTGKRVVMHRNAVSDDFKEEAMRTVTVIGGFGARPETSGTKIMVRFDCDGDTCMLDGRLVERIIE